MTKLNCIAKLNWVTKASAVFLLWSAAAVTLPAQTFTTIHSFDSTDGYAPLGTLAQATNGDLYGTTTWGGGSAVSPCSFGGCGTAFKISRTGEFTSLYSFCATGNPLCPDGAGPQSSVILGSDGNFYGTTPWGGQGTYCCGTVFKLTPVGGITTLHIFCSGGNGCTDGSSSFAALAEGTDGNYYGTTNYGGQGCNGLGCGIVYKISRQGTINTVYAFDSNVGPSQLALGTDGYFRGATADGPGAEGYGSVYKINERGSVVLLTTFDGQNGESPQYPPVEFLNGNWYGTTAEGEGGNGNNAGTIYMLTPTGARTMLYLFCQGTPSNCPDGSDPENLILGSDGNFYGVTSHGGVEGGCAYNYNGCGTVFSITPSGTLTTVYSFCAESVCLDGTIPSSIMQATDGNLYGTTIAGGGNDSPSCDWSPYAGCGTVFQLSLGLPPFVKTNPAVGKVGSKVGILGTNLTGATGVKFNGTATAFRLVSSTFIEAKVPSGATTGKVTVQLPSGTLSSNVPFIVLR